MEYIEPLSFNVVESCLYAFDDVSDISTSPFALLPIPQLFTSEVIGEERIRSLAFLSDGLVEYKAEKKQIQVNKQKSSFMDELDVQVSASDSLFEERKPVKPPVQKEQTQPKPVQEKKIEPQPALQQAVHQPPKPVQQEKKPEPQPVSQQPVQQKKAPRPLTQPLPQVLQQPPLSKPVQQEKKPESQPQPQYVQQEKKPEPQPVSPSQPKIVQEKKPEPTTSTTPAVKKGLFDDITEEDELFSTPKDNKPVVKKEEPKKSLFEDDPFATTVVTKKPQANLIDDPFMFEDKKKPKKNDLSDLESILSSKPKGRSMFDIDDMF
jgi:hypothetical protein